MNDAAPITLWTAVTDPPPRVAPRVALWSIFAFWAFYYVLNSARMAIDRRECQLGMLIRRGGVVAIGIVLSLAMYFILRRLEDKSMRFLLTTAFADFHSRLAGLCRGQLFRLLSDRADRLDPAGDRPSARQA